MPWYVPLLATIANSCAVYPWFLKRWVSNERGLKRRLLLQYIFCLALALAVFAAVHPGTAPGAPLALLVLGAANGFSVYCQWRAVQAHLSKFSLLTFWDDILAIALGYVVLGEAQFINRWLGAGLVCMSVATAGLVGSERMRTAKNGNKVGFRFYRFVLYYTTVSGLASFFKRSLALAGISQAEWLLGWYGGSIVTVLALSAWLSDDPESTAASDGKRVFLRRDVVLAAASSSFVFANAWTSFWTAQVAPITVFQPVLFVAAMVIPVLIGLFAFKEAKGLGWLEGALMALAALGGFLAAYGYHLGWEVQPNR